MPPEEQIKRGFRVRVNSERARLPNGRSIELDIVRHPGAAAVVPFVSADEVLLIRQYRHAAGGMILEVPAGKLDHEEDPALCAARELEEEAGCRAGRLEPLGFIWTTPGGAIDLDTIEVHGTASIVPEPSSLALLAVGFLGLGRRRRNG